MPAAGVIDSTVSLVENTPYSSLRGKLLKRKSDANWEAH
jgi:hypothetical protein